MAKRTIALSCDHEIVEAARKVLPVPLSQFVEHQLLMVIDNKEKYELEQEINDTRSKLIALQGFYCTLVTNEGEVNV